MSCINLSLKFENTNCNAILFTNSENLAQPIPPKSLSLQSNSWEIWGNIEKSQIPNRISHNDLNKIRPTRNRSKMV